MISVAPLTQPRVCRYLGAPTVSTFNGKLHVDLLFLRDPTAPRGMEVLSTCSLLIPVRSKNPQTACDAFRSSRIGVSGRRMEE